MCMQCKETRELIAKTSGDRLKTYVVKSIPGRSLFDAVQACSDPNKPPQRVPHELPRRDAGG
jgi:hypothetical protein